MDDLLQDLPELDARALEALAARAGVSVEAQALAVIQAYLHLAREVPHLLPDLQRGAPDPFALAPVPRAPCQELGQ